MVKNRDVTKGKPARLSFENGWFVAVAVKTRVLVQEIAPEDVVYYGLVDPDGIPKVRTHSFQNSNVLFCSNENDVGKVKACAGMRRCWANYHHLNPSQIVDQGEIQGNLRCEWL